MQSAKVPAENIKKKIRLPILLLGTLLLPINAWLIIYLESVRAFMLPSSYSLFANALAFLIILRLFNLLLEKRWPFMALNGRELVFIYMMLQMGTAFSGLLGSQILVALLPYPHYFPTGSISGVEVTKLLVPWLTVESTVDAKAFYEGNSSLYTDGHWQAWIPALLIWLCFLGVLLFSFWCLSSLLRRQWSERERLLYPIANVPLHIAGVSDDVLKSRLFVIGFIVAAFPHVLNALHRLLPFLPEVVLLKDYGNMLQRPWNGMDFLYIGVSPWVLGLSMLLPVDFLLSLWFFDWFWKGQLIAVNAFGLDGLPNMPFRNQQVFGAYLGIAIFAILTNRAYFSSLWKNIIIKRQNEIDPASPMSQKAALWGLLLSFVFMVAFGHLAAIPWWIGIAFFSLYLLIALVVARMRAEVGVPAHDAHFCGPDQVLTSIFGTRAFSKMTLGSFSLFYWLTRAFASNALPIQLEALRIGDRSNIQPKQLARWLWISGMIGMAAGCWILIYLSYLNGANGNKISFLVRILGYESYTRLDLWLSNLPGWHSSIALAGPSTDWKQVTAISAGSVFAIVLQILRMRWIGFPFHPIAYAVSQSASLTPYWMTFFIAWIAKGLLLRYGGLKAYRKFLPLAIGLITGDMVIGLILTTFGLLR